MTEPEFDEYLGEVFDYLEYIEYPEYVCLYEPEGVSKSIFLGAMTFYILGMSPKKAALTLFGMMWEKVKTNHNIRNVVVN